MYDEVEITTSEWFDTDTILNKIDNNVLYSYLKNSDYFNPKFNETMNTDSFNSVENELVQLLNYIFKQKHRIFIQDIEKLKKYINDNNLI